VSVKGDRSGGRDGIEVRSARIRTYAGSFLQEMKRRHLANIEACERLASTLD
jgi:hypothetical protein